MSFEETSIRSRIKGWNWMRTSSTFLSVCLSYTLSLCHTHTHTLSLSLTHSLAHILSISLSLPHTHTLSLSQTHCLALSQDDDGVELDADKLNLKELIKQMTKDQVRYTIRFTTQLSPVSKKLLHDWVHLVIVRHSCSNFRCLLRKTSMN